MTVPAEPPEQLSLDEPLLTPKEAAHLLRATPYWVTRKARDGVLPCVRVGRRIAFLRSDLEAWVADHRAGHTAHDVPLNADWRKRPQIALAAERDRGADADQRPGGAHGTR
jgi:excisionase family DNA binding protein